MKLDHILEELKYQNNHQKMPYGMPLISLDTRDGKKQPSKVRYSATRHFREQYNCRRPIHAAADASMQEK